MAKVNSRYRPAGSYVSKDPTKRANSLANLKSSKRGRPKGSKNKKLKLDSLDIVEFARDVLGVSFAERPAQEVVLRSLYGLTLTAAQLDLHHQLTSPETVYVLGKGKSEGCWACGARGGKSFLTSIVALFESIVRADHWRQYLQPRETGYALIVATRLQQAEAVIQRNCSRLLEDSLVSYMLKSTWQAELELINGLRIASLPCNSTAGRGLPIFFLAFDELAHFRVEGVKADETVYSALRPRQAQFPGAKCLKISTPAAKQGLFWTEFSEGFAVPDRLTIQAPTRLLNPTIPQKFIDKEYARDPDNAAREFGAEFAETLAGFFGGCIEKLADCFQLAGDQPPNKSFRYFGGIDQSGLTGRDRFAFAVGHNVLSDGKPRTVIDVARSWDTTDDEQILGEIKALAGDYGVLRVSIDRYAGGWVEKALQKIGLVVEIRPPLPVVYSNLKSLILSGHLLLPDRRDLRDGLARTQAYYSKANNLTIGHERDQYGHGDLADAVATCVFLCAGAQSRQAGLAFPDFDEDGDETEPDGVWQECGTLSIAGWE